MSGSETPRDEGELDLRDLVAGDPRAFRTVYDAHRASLYRVAYGILLDREAARDAVQDTFVKLHERARTLDERAPIGAWLRRVLVNHCLDLRRRFLRSARAVFEPARGTTTPEESIVLDASVRVVERTLMNMPVKQRAVATLRLEAELEPVEIADMVGLTPNATRVALHRALTVLRDELGRAGFEPSDAFSTLAEPRGEPS